MMEMKARVVGLKVGSRARKARRFVHANRVRR